MPSPAGSHAVVVMAHDPQAGGAGGKVLIVGLDPHEASPLLFELDHQGIDCLRGGLSACLHPDASIVVLDIRSHHPLVGGPTGWQLVRHLIHAGSSVVAVADPTTGALPKDLDGSSALAVARGFDLDGIANSCRRFRSTPARAA